MKETIFRYAKSTRVRIISAFLAVLIIFAGLPYVGIQATNTPIDIHSGTTSGSVMEGKIGDNIFEYSGKLTKAKVTLFDYVSDYEIGAGYNDIYHRVPRGGYDDAYTSLNTAISSNGSASSLDGSKNITITLKTTSDTRFKSEVYVYLWGSDGVNNIYPGKKMAYDEATDKYTYTFNRTDSSSPYYLNFTPTGLLFNNGAKLVDYDTSIKEVKTQDFNVTMSQGKMYEFKEEPSNETWINFKTTRNLGDSTTNLYLWDNDYGGGGKTVTYYAYDNGDRYYGTAKIDKTSTNTLPGKFNLGGGSSNDHDFGSALEWGMVYTIDADNGDIMSKISHITLVSDTESANTIYNTTYTNPLYFGNFYNGDATNNYTGDSQKPGGTGNNSSSTAINRPGPYNNFYWRANMGLKPQNTNNRGNASVQNLVYSKLSGTNDNGTIKNNFTGNILDVSSTPSSQLELPYFSESWADDHSDLMRYYNADSDGGGVINFPFYEVKAEANSTNVGSDKTIEGTMGDIPSSNPKTQYARFYQFDSKQSNLVFNINSSNPDDHTGYFSETDPTAGKIYSNLGNTDEHVGFFPFNNTDSSGKNNNLGFGTKFEMQFKLNSDGTVGVVDEDGNALDSNKYKTKIDTVFEFEGDDDLWVFIDGVLFLDMGGDHSKSSGTINFAKRTATVDYAIPLGSSETYKNNLGTDPTDDGMIVDYTEFTSRLGADSFEANGDYKRKTHTMTIFYMERGMNDSNLKIRFNYSPEANFSKMKIAEVTKFNSVNDGLQELTKKAAEYDVFKYVVSNKNTDPADVKESTALYPTNEDRIRSNESIDTQLAPTTPGTGEPKSYNFNDVISSVAVYNNATNPATWQSTPKTAVSNTSYWWVDKFITGDTKKLVGKTGSSGDLYLMYGTNNAVYDSNNTGKESSAEFEKQFSRGSTMTVTQSTELRKPAWTASTTENFGSLSAVSGRTVDKYYTTDIRIADRDFQEITPNGDGEFTFDNVNDHSSPVMLTEYFENTVRTGNLEVTKTVTGEDSNTDLFQLKLTLSNIFGVSGVNPAADGYGNITVSGAYNARGNPITKLAADGTFYIKPGAANKVTISDIPYDTDYTITETNGSFFNQTSASISGDIKGENTIVKSEGVVNVRMTGDLVLEKLLGGYPADSSMNDGHEFKFYVTLNIPEGVSDYTIQKGGENLTFTSGEPFDVIVPAGSANKVTISGIPRGTTYTVTETDLQGATSKTESNTSGTIVSDSVTATITNNYPNIIEVTAEKKNSDQTIGLPGAELELWYKDSYLPSATKFNDPFITPTKQVTVTIPSKPTAPSVKSVTYSTENKKMNYSYEYSSENTPSVTSTSWILPRSDNDYIYFRDYNSGDPADYDQQSFKTGQDTSGKQNGKRSWLYTDFSKNQENQNRELNYTHNYWYEAQFSDSTGTKKDVKYSVWERFVDRYTSNGKAQDTVVWKIQPPDGYDKVRFCLYDGSQCIRTTEQITFKLGEIYHKTKWGKYYRKENGKDCYFEVPLTKEGNWAKYRTNSGASDVDKRMAGSTMKQAERYTPTEQKVIFHCNSNTVWHNIHIEFFKNTGTDASPNYVAVGQQFPGYMMEPYAYAGDNYRVGNYLTYELTIPDGATHFRVNNGVNSGLYNYRSDYTKLHNAADKNGHKNYANYFSINGDSSGHNVTSGTAVILNDWTGYPSADERNKTYSSNAVESDYDYIYFEAPNSWGTHIYAYFYGGGNLRDDNWQRACYSVWPGITPVETEFTAGTNSGSDGHSDIYDYPLTGSIANPDNTFVDNNSGTTVYKFKVPLGERRNYSKVIFNNGLKSQVSSTSPATHETGVITYHRGYLYKADGSSYQHYENKPTNQFEQRGDKLYIRTSDHATGTTGKTWDDLHVRFYNASGTQILQSGSGYVMQYSGVNNVSGTDYTYYSIPIPEDAVKFSLSNGKSSYSSNTGTKNDLTTEKYDIPDYDPNLDTDHVTTADVTKKDVVYKLANTSLEQVSPSITMKKEEDTTVSSGSSYTPENPSPRGDHIYIRDAANVLSAIPTIAFYEFESSATAISMSPALTAVELEENPAGTEWYSIGIPTNAAFFTINGGSAKYVIYPKSSGSNQMNATPGDMYYDTVTNTTLAIAWPTFTSDADDFTDEHYTSTSPYGQRGDYLYVVNAAGLTNPKVIFYNSSGVPITNTAGSSEISLKSIGQITAPASGDAPVDGKTSNDTNAQGYWYRAAIPETAAYFVVKYGSATTERSEIFEKKTKINRYSKNYTLGDMQYRISGTSTQLLYPIFTEDPDYTLDAGGGKTISSNGSTVRVDQTKVSDYAGYNAATASTYSSVPDPQQALYQTDTNNATVSWGGGSGSNDGYIYLETKSWWNVDDDGSYGPLAMFSGGDSADIQPTMEKFGDETTNKVWRIAIPEGNYTKVKFRVYGGGSAQNTTTEVTFATGCPTLTYGNGFYYKIDTVGNSSNPVTTVTLDHIVGYEKNVTKWLKFKNNAGWNVSTGNIKAEFLDSSNQRIGSVVDMTLDGDTWKFDMSTNVAFGSAEKVVFSNNGSDTEYVEATLQGTAPKKGWGYTYTSKNTGYLYLYMQAWHTVDNDVLVYSKKEKNDAYLIGSTIKWDDASSYNSSYSNTLNRKLAAEKLNGTYYFYWENGDNKYWSEGFDTVGKAGKVYQYNGSTWSITTPGTYGSGNYGGDWSGPDKEYVPVSSSQSAVYQPEDRYGMISTANSGSTPVTNGTADVNNFIYIKTSVSDPYIMFYKDANATAGQEIGGSNMAATGIKLSEVCGNTGSPYKIRLPKDAMSFRLSDGATTLSTNHVPLQQNINVKSADGTLYNVPLSDPEPYDTLTNYRHAGTTFDIDSDGALDTSSNSGGFVGGIKLRTDFSYPTPSITDPLEPRSDIDYIYFTDNTAGGDWDDTVYAYYYGGEDGEYTAWPGIKASTSDKAPLVYTNSSGKKVFMFQLPKVSDGKYPYVIFTNGDSGSSRKITQAINIMDAGETAYTSGGKNYTVSDTTQHYGTYDSTADHYVLAYAASESTKTSAPTVSYSSNKYIYFINNGTNKLNNSTERDTLDDIHVAFYDNNGTIIGTNEPGYKPDRLVNNNAVVTYTESDANIGTAGEGDVYRISVPDNAVYFQINNGDSDHQIVRKSEKKAVTSNGLYRFVPKADNAAGFIEGDTVGTITDMYFLLDLVNEIKTDEESTPEITTRDIHLATVVTGYGGTISYIKWLRDHPNGIDTNYLRNTAEDIGEGKNVTTVKVIKTGDYYWKESKEPAGYQLNTSPVVFTLNGTETTTVSSTVTDEPLPTGSLTVTKKVVDASGNGLPSEYTNDSTYNFSITFTNSNGFSGFTSIKKKVGTADEENISYTFGSNTSVTVTDAIKKDDANSITNALVISGLPVGTTYQVTETEPLGSGWSTTYKINGGDPVTSKTTPASGYTIIQTGSTVEYTNTYDSTTPTPSTTITLTKTAKEKVGAKNIGDPLQGAVFKLYRSNGTLVTEITNQYTTDSSGQFTITGLSVGDYYLEEITAPTGYSEKDSNVVVNGSVQNKRVYFSVGENTSTIDLTCTDEMKPAYIKLYEHINERLTAWGDPTFIFKITQTKYANDTNVPSENQTTHIVALNVDDDGARTAGLTNHTDPDYNYNTWLEEHTGESEYQGMYHIDSQGRIRLEPGTYTITRVPVSRYKFVENTWKLDTDEDTVYTGVHRTTTEALEVKVSAEETAIVHYYDKVDYYDKFSHVDTKINQFYKLNATTKANETAKGIRVEYNGKVSTSASTATIITSSANNTNANSNTFNAWFINVDGTERPMTAAEKGKLEIEIPSDLSSDFNYNSTNYTLSINNAQSYANKVYTLKAVYKDGATNLFETNFDLVFS